MPIIPGLIVYLILVISLSVHEWAHGYVANKLGDPTPAAFGRLTLNPLAHIDPIGTVAIPLLMILLMPGFAIFGWAKAVPINPKHFRRRKYGELMVSLAGPFSNLILAIFLAIIGACLAKNFGGSVGSLFATATWLNIILFIFNLIPVPPLDGARSLKVLLEISEETFFYLERWGFFILLILINISAFRSVLFVCMARTFGLISSMACQLFGIPQDALLPF
ncbi:MAG: site-2 protease family protein [Puniceicoccales bacterium]|jgi:Zn-dependent protease|nr:site-2 protease family protein [Puniceicoccales bacterium]